MYSIGQIARRTGIKVPTIRYYEQMGLIDPPGRSAGNQRRYDEAGLERLGFIRHARALGLSIDMIRDLISLAQDKEMPCDRAHEIAAQHAAHIREKIARLQRLEAELTRIENSHDSGTVGDCHVLAALTDHSLCMSEH